MPLFSGSAPLTPLLFLFDAVNAAFFPVKRRKLRYIPGLTPFKPLFFQLNAFRAGISPVKRRYCRYFSG